MSAPTRHGAATFRCMGCNRIVSLMGAKRAKVQGLVQRVCPPCAEKAGQR